MNSLAKKGALELSIGTIVILVIGMSMLILGLVLVQKIFEAATYNVNELNDKVKDEINNLFEEDGKSVVYLSNHKAAPKRGDEWGVAFGVRNIERGTSEASTFSYEVKAGDVSKDCRGLTAQKAESLIKARRTGSAQIPPGDTQYFLPRFQIPEDAPLCIVPYDIIVKKGNEIYTQDFFDLVIQP